MVVIIMVMVVHLCIRGIQIIKMTERLPILGIEREPITNDKVGRKSQKN